MFGLLSFCVECKHKLVIRCKLLLYNLVNLAKSKFSYCHCILAIAIMSILSLLDGSADLVRAAISRPGNILLGV